MTDYGSDVSTYPDLDPGFSPLTGRQVVAERLARRFTTPRGSLSWAPNDGTDVRAWLNESVTPARLAEWARALEQEAEKDEAVEGASVSLTYSAMALTISVSLDLADGPFSLVMRVDSVSLTILGPT